MGSMFATRRDGRRVLKPRYMTDAPPGRLTKCDRRNIDALVEMHDAAMTRNLAPEPLPTWLRNMQRAAVELVLRSLSGGGCGSARMAFLEDLHWVRHDAGAPGWRLSDICTEFGWNHAEVREQLLKVAAQAIEGKRRSVPTLLRDRRSCRPMSAA